MVPNGTFELLPHVVSCSDRCAKHFPRRDGHSVSIRPQFAKVMDIESQKFDPWFGLTLNEDVDAVPPSSSTTISNLPAGRNKSCNDG